MLVVVDIPLSLVSFYLKFSLLLADVDKTVRNVRIDFDERTKSYSNELIDTYRVVEAA